jgi:TolA-binding protein
MMAVGMNQFKMRQFSEARKSFQDCLKAFPSGAATDNALLGIVTCQIQQGKIADAEKTFLELKSRYPDSSAAKQAAMNLEQAKTQRK